jgi:tripartite-type tricarboxylate transporter receptor subunit TctC
MATNRMFALASAVLYLGWSAAEPVNAQSYPEKPIKIIVPTNSMVRRALGIGLNGKTLGHPVHVASHGA